MLKYLNRLRLISLNMYGIFLRAKDADKNDFYCQTIQIRPFSYILFNDHFIDEYNGFTTFAIT